MKKKHIHHDLSLALCLCLILLSLSATAQGRKNTQSLEKISIPPSSLEERKVAVKQREEMRQASLFQNYPIREIGPTVMGGRIVDIEGSRQENKRFYVAYASAGVYKTENNGLSFQPIFDNQARLTIGDIAVHPQNDQVIWVGTGENNSSRSSYAGYGVYKSEDGGQNWQHLGLENTQHIGRVVLHPQDKNVAWVASLGALYSHNEERGIYKTTDGGKTWNKTLFINDSTGVVDLIIHPTDPNQLWAAAWERDREAWDFKENGPGSGLYYSEDGGENWQRTTNGLPEAKFMGRIGLDICQAQPETLYLIVDNQEEVKTEKEEDEQKLKFTFEDFKTMAKADFLALNEADVDTFLQEKGFPEKYTAQKVKQEVKQGKYLPEALARYFKSANDDLFDTEVRGAEVYRSDDGGKSWQKVNTYPLEGVFYTYGYYFGQIRVDTQNPDLIYIFGVPLLRSRDGGKTFESITYRKDVHADHHAMWIDPADPNRILNGNDGGLYMSYDQGEHFIHMNNVSAGQFYTVGIDMEKPYNIYGGLQDNGVYKGSSRFEPNQGEYWERIWGGDGMFVQVNPENSNLIYTGLQFGNYWRLGEGRPVKITPQHAIGEEPYRYNWRTPLVMSPHNPDIIYIGSQKLLRSLDKGDHWEVISPDLTKNFPNGNVPYSTLTCISESPLKFGRLYVGTDDGNIQVSRDAGETWELISQNLPPNRWVSSVNASPHDLTTVYASLNGYRYDEIDAHVYVSTDDGKSWKSIQGNLPNEAVNVIIPDPVNPELLYLGTDQGAYLSMNRGETWHLITGDYPNVATYDLIVHPRENELVLASHGRSMYVMDVKPLQAMAAQEQMPDLEVFAIEPVRHSENWGERRTEYLPVSEPEVSILYFTKKSSPVQLQVKNKEGKKLYEKTLDVSAGFHSHTWHLKDQSDQYLKPGQYQVMVQAGGKKAQTTLEVKARK